MNSDSLLGVVTHPHKTRSNDYLFRVTLKAVIIDKDSKVLIVKESGRDWWDIPGGGINHGESIKEGLSRELHEEVGYEGDFKYEPLEVSDPHILKHHKIVQIAIVFLVQTATMEFQPGDDGDDIQFVDPDIFKKSDLRTEQNIYRYSQLALNHMILYE